MDSVAAFFQSVTAQATASTGSGTELPLWVDGRTLGSVDTLASWDYQLFGVFLVAGGVVASGGLALVRAVTGGPPDPEVTPLRLLIGCVVVAPVLWAVMGVILQAVFSTGTR